MTEIKYNLKVTSYCIEETIKREIIHTINQERKKLGISIKDFCDVELFSDDFEVKDVGEISKKTLSNIRIEKNKGKEFMFYIVDEGIKTYYKFNLSIKLIN